MRGWPWKKNVCDIIHLHRDCYYMVYMNELYTSTGVPENCYGCYWRFMWPLFPFSSIEIRKLILVSRPYTQAHATSKCGDDQFCLIKITVKLSNRKANPIRLNGKANPKTASQSFAPHDRMVAAHTEIRKKVGLFFALSIAKWRFVNRRVFMECVFCSTHI